MGISNPLPVEPSIDDDDGVDFDDDEAEDDKERGRNDESQNIAMPASFPNISTDARSDSNAVVVGGVCIGDLPESKAKSRKRGQRGPDKPTTQRKNNALVAINGIQNT